MNTYIIRILSYSQQKPTIVKPVLACTTVSKLLFPAFMYAHIDGGINFNNASEFDLNLVPKEYYAEGLVNIPIDGKNGIKFSSTIYEGKTVVPNAINLKFNDRHLEEGIVTAENLQALLTEIIAVFKADIASIYPRRKKGSKRVPPKYYRTPDNQSYPLEIDWINYFGPQTIDLLGPWRFNALKSCAYKYNCQEGIREHLNG